jgi:hypothetical protein
MSDGLRGIERIAARRPRPRDPRRSRWRRSARPAVEDDRAGRAAAPLGSPVPAPVPAAGSRDADSRQPVGNAEEVVLARAVDVLDERHQGRAQPTVTEVLTIIEHGPDLLRSAARACSPHAYHDQVADLLFTLDLLCTGPLGGVFDGPTTRPIDLDAPAVSVDLSGVKAAGDKLLTAAVLCTWSYGFGCVDAAAALADLRAEPRRSYLGVMDEL